MNIQKETGTARGVQISEAELTEINRLARTPLTAEQIYTFSVRLCDNEIDRDFERFPRDTLNELAGLFVGTTGIFDHHWSAKNQSARLYRTEVVRDTAAVTRTGEGRWYLKGYAYMRRTADNEALIADIDAGIKKEVSIGCAVRRCVCSICGEELSRCGHVRGQLYNGKLCFGELREATDAFEWSFVAVPAQKKAGVVKRFHFNQTAEPATLKELLAAAPEPERWLSDLEKLEKQADLGRRYLEALRRELVRLELLERRDVDEKTLRAIAEKLSEPELLEMKRACEKRLEKRFPPPVQLCYGVQSREAGEQDGAFLI